MNARSGWILCAINSDASMHCYLKLCIRYKQVCFIQKSSSLTLCISVLFGDKFIFHIYFCSSDSERGCNPQDIEHVSYI